MKLARNHTPIIIDTMRTDATLVTNDSPNGDRYSSPNVYNTGLPTNQRMLRLASADARPFAAAIMMMNPSPSSTQPMAILVRLVGSWFRARCQPHSDVSSGVNRKIMNGLNAWYHVDGMVRPKNTQRVFWSAHSCSVLPCCS